MKPDLFGTIYPSEEIHRMRTEYVKSKIECYIFGWPLPCSDCECGYKERYLFRPSDEHQLRDYQKRTEVT